MYLSTFILKPSSELHKIFQGKLPRSNSIRLYFENVRQNKIQLTLIASIFIIHYQEHTN